MLLILSSEGPPPYNLKFSIFLPVTLKHVAISPYYLLLALTGAPSSNIFPSLLGSQISEYLSSPATSLSLSLNDAYLPRREY